MLTGDKLETAENIARSCRLIQGDMTIMRFQEKDKQSLLSKIMDNKATYLLCIKEKRKKVQNYYMLVIHSRGGNFGHHIRKWIDLEGMGTDGSEL